MCGNYSIEETIQERKLYEEIWYVSTILGNTEETNWVVGYILLRAIHSQSIVSLSTRDTSLPKFIYRKVTSCNSSCLEAHAGFFRLIMKGIFDPYVL